MKIFISIPALALTTVALVACAHKAPQGQIAATVNGEDITDGEVRAEIAASAGPNAPPIDRKAAVQRVITRKLLTQYGAANEIDKDPKLLLDQRRMDENLLATRALQSVAGKITPASDSEAATYLTAHNGLYMNRQQLLVDQIVFPEAALAGKAKLPDASSLGTLAEFLTGQKIAFSRRQVVIDTAMANPVAAQALAGKPEGSVTTLSLQGMRANFQVMKERPVPMAEPEAIVLIRKQLSNQAAEKAAANFEQQLRKQAKIELR